MMRQGMTGMSNSRGPEVRAGGDNRVTLLSEHDAQLDARALPRLVVAPRRRRVRRSAGLLVTLVGLAAWTGWLAWRMARPTMTVVGFCSLFLELLAFAAALIVSAGLAAGNPPNRRNRRDADRRRPLPMLLADALDLGALISETACRPNADDTGEIAWARRGIRVLGERRSGRVGSANLRDAAWSVVAIDGLRRAAMVAVLIVVLFSGSVPFPSPPATATAMLFGGVALVSAGHWLLSAGHLRPAARLTWSMSSIGAGLGDGVSRSGLPIRWMATMATIVALNVAIGLRGISDRWTHGLGPMDRDARIVAMSVAVMFVGVGGVALARMPRPDVGFYGATRRLEEGSVRRLALGLTLLVALIGFVAGVLPGDVLAAPR